MIQNLCFSPNHFKSRSPVRWFLPMRMLDRYVQHRFESWYWSWYWLILIVEILWRSCGVPVEFRILSRSCGVPVEMLWSIFWHWYWSWSWSWYWSILIKNIDYFFTLQYWKTTAIEQMQVQYYWKLFAILIFSISDPQGISGINR